MTSVKLKTIPIAEVFGPTIQGEGRLAGVPTYFVRVGGCDYDCVWCDSGHAVLAESVRGMSRLTQVQIYNQLIALPMGPEWLTISGGNPALYDLTELVRLWQKGRGFGGGRVAVETQGSKWYDWLAQVDLLTISPKPPSSGLDADVSSLNLEAFLEQMRNVAYEEIGRASSQQVVFKVVVFDEEDYQFARDCHALHSNFPFYLSVGTAMGGLSGQWVPPVYQEQVDSYSFDKFKQIRGSVALHGGVSSHVGNVTTTWTAQGLSDDERSLLNRYRWLADRVKTDQDMADVAVFPQLHVLLYGHVKGV